MELTRRMRRLRENPILRGMVEETRLSKNNLIYPMFVVEGKGIKEEIKSMAGIFRQSEENILKEIDEVVELGIPGVILFGIPEKKDSLGTEAYSPGGVIQNAVKAIKKHFDKHLLIVTDICLCEYTDHGHCGPVENGVVVNDPAVEIYCKTALSHADAGADMVAPSDMMDGRVGAIRSSLDKNGFSHMPILAYSAKYASAFYGPFREAVSSTPQFGDRKGYQMNPANSDEAISEVALDIEEGADIVMVKPALPYLDIIRRIKDTFEIPIAAYNVSGEYAVIKAAGKAGFIDEEKVMMESLLSIKRAGASIILTYFAKDAARLLKA